MTNPSDITKVLVEFRYVQRKLKSLTTTIASEPFPDEVAANLVEVIGLLRNELDTQEAALSEGTIEEAVTRMLSDGE